MSLLGRQFATVEFQLPLEFFKIKLLYVTFLLEPRKRLRICCHFFLVSDCGEFRAESDNMAARHRKIPTESEKTPTVKVDVKSGKYGPEPG